MKDPLGKELIAAATNDELEEGRRLLAEGADIEWSGTDKATALSTAC